MTHAPRKHPELPWRAVGGFILTVVSGGLLVIGAVVFAFTGYCEDSCDRPPWTLWRALQNGLPFAAVAIGLMTGVAYATMRGRNRTWLKALITSIVSSTAFVGAILLVVAGAAALSLDPEASIVVGVIVAPPTWYVMTTLLARGIAGRSVER
jgi:hypothetical protein